MSAIDTPDRLKLYGSRAAINKARQCAYFEKDVIFCDPTGRFAKCPKCHKLCCQSHLARYQPQICASCFSIREEAAYWNSKRK